MSKITGLLARRCPETPTASRLNTSRTMVELLLILAQLNIEAVSAAVSVDEGNTRSRRACALERSDGKAQVTCRVASVAQKLSLVLIFSLGVFFMAYGMRLLENVPLSWSNYTYLRGSRRGLKLQALIFPNQRLRQSSYIGPPRNAFDKKIATGANAPRTVRENFIDAKRSRNEAGRHVKNNQRACGRCLETPATSRSNTSRTFAELLLILTQRLSPN